MWQTVTPLPSYGLFTRQICEINPIDLGNVDFIKLDFLKRSYSSSWNLLLEELYCGITLTSFCLHFSISSRLGQLASHGNTPSSIIEVRASSLLGSVQSTQALLLAARALGGWSPSCAPALAQGSGPAWHGWPQFTSQPCRACIPPLAIPSVRCAQLYTPLLENLPHIKKESPFLFVVDLSLQWCLNKLCSLSIRTFSLSFLIQRLLSSPSVTFFFPILFLYIIWKCITTAIIKLLSYQKCSPEPWGNS